MASRPRRPGLTVGKPSDQHTVAGELDDVASQSLPTAPAALHAQDQPGTADQPAVVETVQAEFEVGDDAHSVVSEPTVIVAAVPAADERPAQTRHRRRKKKRRPQSSAVSASAASQPRSGLFTALLGSNSALIVAAAALGGAFMLWRRFQKRTVPSRPQPAAAASATPDAPASSRAEQPRTGAGQQVAAGPPALVAELNLQPRVRDTPAPALAGLTFSVSDV